MDKWVHETFFAGAIIDDETGKSLEYWNLMKSDKYQKLWSISLANEIGRLAQGIHDIKCTDTFFFIQKSDIPKDRRERMSRTGAS